MSTWSWKTIDYSKAKAGDIILTDTDVCYIKSIDVIGRYSTNQKEISPEYRVNLVEYEHQFRYRDEPGAGYGFSCFDNGELPNPQREIPWTDGTSTPHWQHFENIKNDPSLIYLGIERWERSFNVARVIECVCGEPVSLNMIMTNTCEKCHRDYNVGGQLLAPRSQWGWDTGETADDILSSDWGINDHPDEDYDYS